MLHTDRQHDVQTIERFQSDSGRLANPGRLAKDLLRVARRTGPALQQSGAHSICETPEL